MTASITAYSADHLIRTYTRGQRYSATVKFVETDPNPTFCPETAKLAIIILQKLELYIYSLFAAATFYTRMRRQEMLQRGAVREAVSVEQMTSRRIECFVSNRSL